LNSARGLAARCLGGSSSEIGLSMSTRVDDANHSLGAVIAHAAVKVQWIGCGESDAEFGACTLRLNGEAASHWGARGIESALDDIVLDAAVEGEGDCVSNCTSDGAWIECEAALSDCDADGCCSSKRSKGCCRYESVKHLVGWIYDGWLG